MEMVHLVPRGSAVVLAPWSFQANTTPRRHACCSVVCSEGKSGNGGHGGGTEGGQVEGSSLVAGLNPVGVNLIGCGGNVISSLLIVRFPFVAGDSGGLFHGEEGAVVILAHFLPLNNSVRNDNGEISAVSVGAACRKSVFEGAFPTFRDHAGIVSIAGALRGGSGGVGGGKGNSDLGLHL